MRLLAALALLQSPDRVELRAGLDILYGGRFEAAAHYFADLGARDPWDAAPPLFEAGAYIWWGAALQDRAFERRRIDSLLSLAIGRGHDAMLRTPASSDAEFWLATAYGYRARQREVAGDGRGAARDAKHMRAGYDEVLRRDSTRADCYLGLGLYEYGLARTGALKRLLARIAGLGGGDAARGLRHLRRAVHEGDLARVEAAWVLAVALAREAERDRAGRAVLLEEARGFVELLALRYPQNPVFARFLGPTADAAGTAWSGAR